MGLYPYDIPPAMSVDEALDMTGLTDKADARLTDLSGGERRRTFIAMTLLQGAGLLLLDEPLANLDIKYQIDLIRLLKKLREVKNISVVMALHDINIALQFEKVILIKEGNIIKSGRPEDVLSRSMLRKAFDVDIEVKKTGTGGIYISFENNL
jgi:iron complex transport system ATP-binding protein